MDQNTGKYIVIGGLGLVVIGLLIYFLHHKLHWLGRLPGDVRIERENFRFYFPFTTMLLISLILTLVINLVKKFL
jgi:H+/Cl- antiporter ClcA